jgi:hypothetical protein
MEGATGKRKRVVVLLRRNLRDIPDNANGIYVTAIIAMRRRLQLLFHWSTF